VTVTLALDEDERPWSLAPGAAAASGYGRVSDSDVVEQMARQGSTGSRANSGIGEKLVLDRLKSLQQREQ
jgi:hypothetical protein